MLCICVLAGGTGGSGIGGDDGAAGEGAEDNAVTDAWKQARAR